MGNSLMDILVFGRRAGESVKDDLPERGPLTMTSLNQFRKTQLNKKCSPIFFPAESKMTLEFNKADIESEKLDSSTFKEPGEFEPPDPFAR